MTMKKGFKVTNFNIKQPEKPAKFSAFSYLIQKKANVSPRNWASSSEAALSTL